MGCGSYLYTKLGQNEYHNYYSVNVIVLRML